MVMVRVGLGRSSSAPLASSPTQVSTAAPTRSARNALAVLEVEPPGALAWPAKRAIASSLEGREACNSCMSRQESPAHSTPPTTPPPAAPPPAAPPPAAPPPPPVAASAPSSCSSTWSGVRVRVRVGLGLGLGLGLGSGLGLGLGFGLGLAPYISSSTDASCALWWKKPGSTPAAAPSLSLNR